MIDDRGYQIYTFGCKVNTYDSGLIQKNLQSNLNSIDKNKQIHILNTCAVTAEATKEAVKMVRRIKAKSPLATIVVTGCAAQVDTDSFSSLPGVDLVIANSHKGLLPQIIEQYFKGSVKEKTFKSNIFRKDDLEMGGGEESTHTRSFLKIQDGCNSFCSFCIIPYARGTSRSIPAANLVHKINELVKDNIKEVVLTGVHIGDYEESGSRLEDLVEKVLTQTQIPRIRLTSLEPIEISDRLLEMYKDPRLLPHFHLSIQSANTDVLKAMKRNYTQAEVKNCFEKLRNRIPGCFIGMDVIVGFPTETEEQFIDTYQTLAEAPWSRIHVFPYSDRKGTKAEAMSHKVLTQDKINRAQKLRELSLHRYQSEALQQVGTVKNVLTQKNSSKGGHGLSEDYWNVFIEDENFPKNEIVKVKITNIDSKGNWIEPALRGYLV